MAQKNLASIQKYVGKRLEDFVYIFGKLPAHPYMWFWKKETQILIANQKKRVDGTKKVRLVAKKKSLETRGFRTHFWEVDHPYVILK